MVTLDTVIQEVADDEIDEEQTPPRKRH